MEIIWWHPFLLENKKKLFNETSFIQLVRQRSFSIMIDNAFTTKKKGANFDCNLPREGNYVKLRNKFSHFMCHYMSRETLERNSLNWSIFASHAQNEKHFKVLLLYVEIFYTMNPKRKQFAATPNSPNLLSKHFLSFNRILF